MQFCRVWLKRITSDSSFFLCGLPSPCELLFGPCLDLLMVLHVQKVGATRKLSIYITAILQQQATIMPYSKVHVPFWASQCSSFLLLTCGQKDLCFSVDLQSRNDELLMKSLSGHFSASETASPLGLTHPSSILQSCSFPPEVLEPIYCVF